MVLEFKLRRFCHIQNALIISSKTQVEDMQGEGSGVTGGGQGGRVPPETCDWEIFADVSGKKRQGKKEKGVKIEKKRMKIVKGKVENLKLKRKSYIYIYIFLTFQITKRRKFVLGLPKWEFLPGKSISRREKNQEKLPPSE